MNDGLGACTKDINRIQKMLMKRPSGYDKYQSWTHQLDCLVQCDVKADISERNILQSIKNAVEKASPTKFGVKCICLYYTGHGQELSGNWVFQDGDITL